MNTKKIIATIGTTTALAIGSQISVAPAPVTIQEWQEITAMYNGEIQKMGGAMTVQDFKGDIKQVNDLIRTRSPESEEYGVEREKLLKKTEKRTVLEIITK